MVYAFTPNFSFIKSCNQDQQCQDQDRDRQTIKNETKQMHIAHNNSQSFMNVVKQTS